MKLIKGIEFTDREYDVVACLISGKTAKSIGAILKISPNTVNVHIRNIAFRIQRNNKNDIIVFAESSDEYESLRKRYDELTGNPVSFDNVRDRAHNFFASVRRHLSVKATTISICIIFSAFVGVLIIAEDNRYIVKSISLNIGDDKLLYRPNVKNKVEKAFQYGNMKTAVLLGPGGSGKTTIARCYMLKKDSPIMFQINCENATTVWQSIYELANLLAISESDMNMMVFIKNLENESARRKKLIQFISSRLRKINKWGLLFDNVSNFNEISECFPCDRKNWGDGYVIVTTRNANIADNSIFKEGNIIKVGELSDAEKQELFYKITKQRYLGKDLIAIPSMPLDVCIAAHYMQESKMGLGKYISFLHSEKNEPFTREVMKNSIGYDKTRYSIVTTSFEEIIKQNRFYKELLLMICLLNSQNISVKYLWRYTDRNTVDKFLFLLKKYSLIDLVDNKITVHRATQHIGIEYLYGLFSEEEKRIVVDKIVHAMTRYNELMWYLYNNQQHQVTHKEIRELIPHLETLKTNIESSSVADKELYTTRILLAMLYAHTPSLPRLEVRKLARTILNRNKNYIVDYDLAALIIHYAYSGLPSLQSEDETLLKKCVKICEKLHAHNLQAFAEMYLANFYCQRNDFHLCKQHLSYAMDMAKTKKMRLLINYRYCSLFLDMCVSKKEMEKVISFTLDTLDSFGANKFFHLKKEHYSYEEMTSHCIAALRKILISLYNAIEDYDMAEKNYREAKFFYVQRRERNNIDTIKYEGYVDIEYAYTLLRRNKLEEAYILLRKSIDELRARNYTVYNAFVYKSEIDARFKKWDEVENDVKLAQVYQVSANSRRQKLFSLVLLFNKSVADFYLGKTEKFKNDIAEFYSASSEFFDQNEIQCLDLNLIKSEADISEVLKKHLSRSYQSFSQVLGGNHPFVKNHISSLLKECSL